MSKPWLPKRADLPGIVLALVIGAVSVVAVRSLPPSPLLSDVLLALLLGALVLNTPLARVVGLTGTKKDRYGAGLRFTGKWILRLSIVLMGMKVQTSFFGKTEITTIFVVAAASIPSAFFVAHLLGVALRVRRPLVDLLAGGTMICGASAVNAIAPACGARRDEQGVAIAVVFLFSVTAMLSFRTIAFALGLDSSFAGLWSGLAVNDLASAVAVGTQMGESGGVMAAASKSARILLLAPVLVSIALARRDEKRSSSSNKLWQSVVDALPEFILGYIALAIVRAVGDRAFAQAPAWQSLIAGNRFVLDLLMSAVAAGIGLNLSLAIVLGSSVRAVGVGAGTSVWMAGLTVTMIAFIARGQTAAAAAIGGAGLFATLVLHRLFGSAKARAKQVEARFARGERLTIEEAMVLLEEHEKTIDDAFLRTLLGRVVPASGELDPVRQSPHDHGEGGRWLTYWEGASGWALIAVVREAGSATPIHAHPHRMIGRAIEGQLEELRFRETETEGLLELASRSVLEREHLVEVDGLETIHVVRAVGTAIDLQMRGPETGKPGRVLRPRAEVDFSSLEVGVGIPFVEEVDVRPGHGGDGAGAGRPPSEAA